MNREALLRRIAAEGRVTFRDAMDASLNDPRDGWYGAGKASIGSGGDFTTSPELSPVFGGCVAEWVVGQFERMERDELTIVEFGAGKGTLATSVLDALRDEWPRVYAAVRYMLVELSAPMRTRAHAATEAHAERVEVVEAMDPARLRHASIVISNEFVDALPVHVVRYTADGAIEELFVEAAADGRLTTRYDRPSSQRIVEFADRFFVRPEPNVSFVFEVALDAWDWIEGVARGLSSGAILTFDYGDVSARVAGPHWPQGSLRAMRDRRPVADIADSLFEADLTVDVNFDVLARTCEENGWTVRTLVAQEPWLIRNGAVERMARAVGGSLAERLAMKALLAPGFGDRLKVLEMEKRPQITLI